jgi:hypothetical protein
MILDENIATQAIKEDMKRKQADSILDMLIKDEEFREVFERKLRELKFEA